MKQVKVLVVEDEDEKAQAIKAEIVAYFGAEADFDHCGTFSDATRKILERRYDLIVLDLMLPRRRGDVPTDVSDEMIEHLQASEPNCKTTVVAISRFEDVIAGHRGNFAKAGIFLIRYEDAEQWKSCLQICMQRVSFKTIYDFVILCALEIERSAFEAVHHPHFELGELSTQHGLDVREVTIGDLRGICVLQPRMGLVDASIVATRALDAFNPKVVCMAGICGGFAKEAKLGALLVTDVTWEHQAGKWRGDEFEIRSYQESLDNGVRTTLSQLIQRDPNLTQLASKRHEIPMPQVGAALCATVSGSAVIASTKYAEIIKGQHGKVAGVDMEVFGVHRAAALYQEPVICFAAKTVVDLADEAKGDDLQQAGAILSARFVIQAIEALLQEKRS